MTTVFWEQKGNLLVEFMEHGRIITAASYSVSLHGLQRANQNKGRGILSSGIVLRDNARRPCSSNKEDPATFSMGSVWPTTLQPGLGFLWFKYLSLHGMLGRITSFWHNELQMSIVNWLKAQVVAIYDEGIGKLVPSYEKCLLRSGDYVEK